MKTLFLSVALPALMLAAAPALAEGSAADPTAAAATPAPPHFPRDLSPEGVKAADDHLALEEVDGAEAKAFVAAENAKSLSALTGDNVVEKSEKLGWYQGPTLIELLESLSVYDESHDAPFRFPVQLVARHNGHEANDFRGYMGRIEAGKVSVGDKLVVQPSGQSATVKDILTLEGSHQSAVAGQSITLLLEEYLDISRGDLLASADQPATQLKQLRADVCWMSDEPLDVRRKYWIKHGTRQTAARITKIDSLLDINTQQRHPAEALKLNDVARIALTVQQPLAADDYTDSRATGAFILIDEVTHQTVAAGMIRIEE